MHVYCYMVYVCVMYIIIWHIYLYMLTSSSVLGITCMLYDRLHCTNINLNGLALRFSWRFLDDEVVEHLLGLVNGCGIYP